MQQEYFGFGKIALLPEILALNNATRPLFVTGQASFSGSGAESAIRSCLADFSRYPRFSSFSVNPKLEDALTGCEILLRERCDSIVAIGGGSPIDMAKAISAIHGDLEHAKEVAVGSRPLSGNPLPLIVIPTTAGTGSEATHFAVIYVDGLKYSLADARLLPTASIIDPELTLAVSAHQTACSGFDALCQAVESLWAVASTGHTRAYSRSAIQLIVANLPVAVAEPSSRSARLAMALAANLAGKAIDVTKTTAPHALSYALTSHHGVPHGHAVALTLGRFFTLHADASAESVTDPRGKDHVDKMMAEIRSLFGCSSAAECEAWWYRLVADCGLEVDPVRLGVSAAADIDRILDGVNLQRLGNHPVQLSRDQLRTTLLPRGAGDQR